MRAKAILAALGLILLVSGCATPPNYSIFKNVSASKLNAIKKVVKEESIRNLDFPTELPYEVTFAGMPKPAINPALKHYIEYTIGSKQRYLDVQAQSVPKTLTYPSDVAPLMNQVVVKLSDGTKALYGNNGAVSQLIFIKNGVEYTLASGRGGPTSRPDLSKQNLIKVANSFS
jgi:hypothetical protein